MSTMLGGTLLRGMVGNSRLSILRRMVEVESDIEQCSIKNRKA